MRYCNPQVFFSLLAILTLEGCKSKSLSTPDIETGEVVSFLQIIAVIGLSSVKFIGGILLVIAFNFPFWMALLFTFGGGMIGVVIFSFFSDLIERWYFKFFKRKRKPKPITKTRRFIIKLRKNYGLIGIAFFTPVLLTTALSTIAANFIEP
jgi:hypothetical protein